MCYSNAGGRRGASKVIYRLCDVEAYEEECLVSSTAKFRKGKAGLANQTQLLRPIQGISLEHWTSGSKASTSV